jgi:hypothetical protein
LSWNLEEAVEHLTMAILVNLKFVIVCFSRYASCVDSSVSGTALPPPWQPKWQVIPYWQWPPIFLHII